MARIVSTTEGMMKPLIGKLAMLMGDDYNMLTGMRTQVSFLEKELSAMSAALEKMELMDDEHFDPQAKNWRDHVREMSYDMEDCVDDFMRDLGSANATSSGFVQKITQFFQTMWASYQIGRRIEELKVLALEANERRLRYKIDDYINSASGVVPIDPRISAIYQEAAGLVGIDGPREELVGWLKDSSRKLKVVSIVGFGGLGKTTLAKQVYDEIRGQFGCKAFVPVSQRPDMTSLLTGLQLKLGMEESSRVHELCGILEGGVESMKRRTMDSKHQAVEKEASKSIRRLLRWRAANPWERRRSREAETAAAAENPMGLREAETTACREAGRSARGD